MIILEPLKNNVYFSLQIKIWWMISHLTNTWASRTLSHELQLLSTADWLDQKLAWCHLTLGLWLDPPLMAPEMWNQNCESDNEQSTHLINVNGKLLISYTKFLTLSLYNIWTPLMLPTKDCIIATAWLKCIPKMNIKHLH